MKYQKQFNDGIYEIISSLCDSVEVELELRNDINYKHKKSFVEASLIGEMVRRKGELRVSADYAEHIYEDYIDILYILGKACIVKGFEMGLNISELTKKEQFLEQCIKNKIIV